MFLWRLGFLLCCVMDVPSPVLPAAEMSDGRCVRRRLQSKSRPVWDSLSDGGAARGGLWSEFQEGEFGGLDSRQQYKKVYNKFFKWVSSNPQVQNTSESSCCRALLQLAVVDLSSLVKKQKSRLLVFLWSILLLQPSSRALPITSGIPRR